METWLLLSFPLSIDANTYKYWSSIDISIVSVVVEYWILLFVSPFLSLSLFLLESSSSYYYYGKLVKNFKSKTILQKYI